MSAITIPRAVLEQALEWANNHGEIVFAGGGWKAVDGMNAWTQTLRAALAQQEQEPVAWMLQHRDTGRKNYVSNDGCNGPGRFLVMNPRYALVCALYTHPPRCEWQGLTTQEAMALTDTAPKGVFYGCDAGIGMGIWLAAVAAAEQALKEKNNG